MKGTIHPLRYEPRWPVALAILAVILLMALLPQAIRLLPVWVTYALGVAVLLPVVGVGWSSAQPGWMRAERGVILLFFAVSVVLILVNLPASVQQLLADNDVALYDLQSDPEEMDNLANPAHPKYDEELLAAMNEKLNALISEEIGEDKAMLAGSNQSPIGGMQ